MKNAPRAAFHDVPAATDGHHGDATKSDQLAIRQDEWEICWQFTGLTRDRDRAARMRLHPGAYSRVMTGAAPVTWGFAGRALYALGPYSVTFDRLFTTSGS